MPTTLGRDDLIASLFSLARFDRDLRPRVPFEERIANAAAAGFAAVGAMANDYLAVRATGMGDDDIAAVLDHHGMLIGELDDCPIWLGDHDPTPEHERLEDTFFHLAERFGPVHHAVVPLGFDLQPLPPADLLAERCAHLAERAAAADMLLALEFFPWSPVGDAAAAWAVARSTANQACGINVDLWHHHTGADDPDVLRSVPGTRVHGVHLTDGEPDLTEPDPRRRTMSQRRVPGEGVFPVEETVRLLDALGVDVPYTVEVVSLPHRHLSPAEFAVALYDASRAVLDRARGSASA